MARQRRNFIVIFVLGVCLMQTLTLWAQTATPTHTPYPTYTTTPNSTMPPPTPMQTPTASYSRLVELTSTQPAALIEAIDSANAYCINQSETQSVIIRLPHQARYEIGVPHNTGVGANGLPQIQCAITIDGNGSIITRSGSADYRFFQVNRYNTQTRMGGFLTLRNITLEGGRASHAGGGAILIQMGRVTLHNVTLRQNTTNFYDAFGGAIYNFKGMLEIYDSTLTDNHAHNASTNWRGGGAIGFDGGQGSGNGIYMRIMNSTIANNTTDGAGGGIFAYYDTSLQIENTDIIGNIGAIGGGIYKVGGGHTTLISTRIMRNLSTQPHTGGGIHSEADRNINLQNEMCIAGNHPYGIVNASSSLMVAQGVWWGHPAGASNSTHQAGDAVTAAVNTESHRTTAPQGCLTLPPPTPESNAAALVIINSTFTDNQAQHGGAIAANTNAIYLEGTTFTNNHAHREGGAIYFIQPQPAP